MLLVCSCSANCSYKFLFRLHCLNRSLHRMPAILPLAQWSSITGPCIQTERELAVHRIFPTCNSTWLLYLPRSGSATLTQRLHVYMCNSLRTLKSQNRYLHIIPYHTIFYHTIPYHTIPYHNLTYCRMPLKEGAFGPLLSQSAGSSDLGDWSEPGSWDPLPGLPEPGAGKTSKSQGSRSRVEVEGLGSM